MAKTLVETRNPNDPGHITDHEFSARLVNELYGVNAYAPAAGATVNPDVALGGVHEVALPAGNVTIGPATSSDPAGGIQRYNTGQRLVLVLTQPAAGGATVTWDASWRRATSGIDPRPNAVTTIEFVNDAAPGAAPQWRPSAVAPTAVESVRVWHTDAANPAEVVQGAVAQATDLTRWQTSAGTVVARVDQAGGLTAASISAASSTLTGSLQARLGTFAATAAADVPLTAKGAASQTGDLTQWLSSTAAVLAAMSAAGVLTAAGFTTAGVLNVSGGGAHSIVGSLTETGQTLSQPATTAQIPQVMKGLAAQSGDLTQWQSSTGGILAAITATGVANLSGVSASTSGVNAPDGGTVTAWLGTSAAGSRGLVVRGFTGQTAALTEWQNSSGGKVVFVDPVGRTTINPSLTPNATLADSGLTVTPRAASGLGAMIMGAGGQTGNLLDFRDSGNNVMASVWPDGSLGPVRTFAGSDTRRLNIGSFGLMQDRNIGGDTSGADSYKTVMGYNAYVSVQSTNTWTHVNDYANKWRTEMGGRGVKTGFRASSNGTHETWTDSGWTDIFTLSMDSPTALIRSSGSGNIVAAVQAASGQTNDIFQWQNNGGAAIAKIDSAGIYNGPAAYVGALQAFPVATAASFATDVFVAASNANNRALVVRGAASQVGGLLELQNSGTSPLAAIKSDGKIWMPYGSIGGDNRYGTNSTAHLSITSSGTGNEPLILRGASGQAVDLTTWQNSTPAAVARVTNGGNVQGTGAYTTLSDAAVKTNVRALVHDPLDVIRRLKPRHFDYLDGGPFGGERDQVGWVAQEVAAVLPQAVVPFGDKHLGTRSEAIVAYLVAAVQELDRRTAVAA